MDSGSDVTSLGNVIIDAESLVPLVGEHLPVRGTNTAYGPPRAEGEESKDGVDKDGSCLCVDGLVEVEGALFLDPWAGVLAADVVEVEW